MSHITTAELAGLAGITTRHLQRLLHKGEIPGAKKTDAGHWWIADSQTVRRWASSFSKWPSRGQRTAFHGVPADEWISVKRSINKSARAISRKSKTEAPSIASGEQEVLAAEIMRAHAKAERLAEKARKAIDSAVQARVDAAALVETAKKREGSGSFFAKWWRDQGLPLRWAARYMSLAFSGFSINKDCLRKCGILPEPEEGNPGRKRSKSGLEWFRHVGKLRTELTQEKIKAMSPVDRAVVARQLRDVAELYKESLK